MNFSKKLLSKIIDSGNLLETNRSTEAQREYLDYMYNGKFYRICNNFNGEFIFAVKIKRENLSEWSKYHMKRLKFAS
jgi:hypothetical protein